MRVIPVGHMCTVAAGQTKNSWTYTHSLSLVRARPLFSERSQGMYWVLPLLLASATWGVAEVLTDEVIEDDHEGQVKKDKSSKHKSGKQKSLNSAPLMPDRGKLTAENATAVAAATILPLVLLVHSMNPCNAWDPANPAWRLAVLGGFLTASANFLVRSAHPLHFLSRP
jgi:hypothetical protein